MINYSLKDLKWTDDTITWSYASFSYSLDASVPFTSTISAVYQHTVAMALLTWESVADVTFQQIPDSADQSQAADIRLGFANVANGSEIGLTAYRSEGSSFLSGVSVFLEDPATDPLVPSGSGTFTYQGTTTQLYQVVLHEIGHALGLNHSSDPNAIMYPTLGPLNQTLDASDIAGIDAIYGNTATITPQTLGIPVFRFYNPTTGARFFTDSKAESGQIQGAGQGWQLEGIGFNAANPSNDPGAAPVYRFYDAQTGDHFYTISQSEFDHANTLPAMHLEGVAFYEDASARPGDAAVYRFYDTGSGQHLYTAGVAEMNSLAASDPAMKLEGVAFYSPT
jgi:predicted Zn-dependent protease